MDPINIDGMNDQQALIACVDKINAIIEYIDASKQVKKEVSSQELPLEPRRKPGRPPKQE